MAATKHVTRRAGAAACLVLVLTSGCDNPEAPSADLSGDWEFSFSAFSQTACPQQPALMPGCAGGGRLMLGRTTEFGATHSYRASCQTCREALEYGVTDQPLRVARLSEGALEFSLAGCAFAADVPPDTAETVSGTVVCALNDVAGRDVRGTWTMSRR